MYSVLIVLPNGKTRTFESPRLKPMVTAILGYAAFFPRAECTLWGPDGELLAFENASR